MILQKELTKERKATEKKEKLSHILHEMSKAGGYEQCRFGFKKDNQYCALGGVLDYLGVNVDDNEIRMWNELYKRYPEVMGKTVTLPASHNGIGKDRKALDIFQGITKLNDWGYTYHEIADFIERQGY
tara:strand:- start:3368 stop:3751 length:384 start_codon:yes stop_codon:yes gene_type:complete